MEHNKLVYIASPYSGDVERNVAFAKAACRYAMNQFLCSLQPYAEPSLRDHVE